MTPPVRPDADRSRLGTQDRQVTVKRRDVAVLEQEDDASAGGGVALYTVPPNFTATGRVYLSERAGAAATFFIALRKAGAALANAHYIAGPTADLDPDEMTCTEELKKLPAGCIVQVGASTANVSFSFLGIAEPVK